MRQGHYGAGAFPASEGAFICCICSPLLGPLLFTLPPTVPPPACRVVYGDRDVQATMSRLTGALSFQDVLRMLRCAALC